MRALLTALAMFMLIIGTTTNAHGQCTLRSLMLEKLKQQFKETVLYQGLNSRGIIIEILISPKNTFTIITTSPNGMSCIIAEGIALEKIVPPLGDST